MLLNLSVTQIFVSWTSGVTLFETPSRFKAFALARKDMSNNPRWYEHFSLQTVPQPYKFATGQVPNEETSILSNSFHFGYGTVDIYNWSRWPCFPCLGGQPECEHITSRIDSNIFYPIGSPPLLYELGVSISGVFRWRTWTSQYIYTQCNWKYCSASWSSTSNEVCFDYI